MTTKRTRRPKPRNFDLAIPFEQQDHRLPAVQRPALTYVRRQRLSRVGRHHEPDRTSRRIDETGCRHRL
jgi:hypothetical protein